MVQRVRLLTAMFLPHIRRPAEVPDILFLIQHPVNMPGKVAENGPSHSHKVQGPGFSQAQQWPLQTTGKRTGRQNIPASLCLSLLSLSQQ